MVVYEISRYSAKFHTSLLPQCGRRAGDEGRLAHLIAVGGRASSLLWAKDLAAKALNKTSAFDRYTHSARWSYRGLSLL